MKIALIVTTQFDDYKLLEKKLDELKVKEIIAGTSNSYNLVQEYVKTRPNVKISLAKGQTSHVSIAYNAINEKKNLKIYSYKQKAFNIEQKDDYLKISFSGNLQKDSKIDSINLNKEQVEKLINRLTELKNNL